MKTEHLWESHVLYTLDLSTVSRQLAFASIAVCWTIGHDLDSIKGLLLYAMGATSLFFIFEILQYILGAGIHYYLARKSEKLNDGEIDKKVYHDWPAYLCLTCKILLLLASYILIFNEILMRI
jgi:hypothetical protein